MAAIAFKDSEDVPKLRILGISFQYRIEPREVFLVVNTQHKAHTQEIIGVNRPNLQYFFSMILPYLSLIISNMCFFVS